MKTMFKFKAVIVLVSLIGAIAILVFVLPQEWRGHATSKATEESGRNPNLKHGDDGTKATPSDMPAAAGSSIAAAAAGGFTSVKLGAAMQEQSGIKEEPLEAASYQTESVAYGTVLDLHPLTELRTRFNAALAEAEIARAAANVSKQEYERTQALYQDNQNMSLKALQKAEQAYLSDEAKLEAATLAIQDMRGSARQQYGEPLASWALARASPEFQKFLKREEVIVRITLPPGLKISAPSRIQVGANNNPRVNANLVSASPQSDPLILGSAYFYRTSTLLAAGTRVTAHFPTSSQPKRGVFIPGVAIVWYAGQAWSYVQLDQERFERRAVPDNYAQDGGFFVTDGFKPGDRIVVKGAQLMLSEELRSQIQTGDGGDQN
ncbi:MAG TPA: metal transporter [Burkholderiales bacterium]